QCRVLAVDPVAHNIDRAHATVVERDMSALVQVCRGEAGTLPCVDHAADFVWCRDVLNHVREVESALREVRPILRPGGRALVFQTFATELLEPKEAERLYGPLATIPENMSSSYFERAVAASGLRISERNTIGSEWREYLEETGNHRTSRQLLHIARLR